MADNILTKDRADVDLDIAAKDISGVQFPRNILTDAARAASCGNCACCAGSDRPL